MRTDVSTFAKYGLGVSVGLVVMLWSFESLHWYNYMRANPRTGSISGSVWPAYPLFMLGAVIAFTALLAGLQRAIHDESEQ
jgi:hypothetical protein